MTDPTKPANEPAAPSTSRREFLTRTAALAGAGAVLGSCGTTSMMVPYPKAKPRTPVGDDEPVRMGLIGTGGMGTEHCRAIVRLAKAGEENVQIVALSDVCQARLEVARKHCADEQGITVDTYDDYEDLLARDDIHGVLIASPEHWHAQMTIDAVLAGKDVYCEKPMTLRLPEALQVYELSKSNPEAIIQVGTQFMTHPKYSEAKKLIAAGAIGKPVFSQTSYCRNSLDGEWLYYGIDPEWEPGVNLDWKRWCGPMGLADWDPQVYARWRRYRKWSTGIIGDLLVHVTTPLVYSLDMGWPTRVTASGGHYVDKAMENHDQVNLTVEFEGEHTMIIAGSTCNEQGLETMIRGHEATLYMAGKDVVLRPERHWVDDIEERTITCDGDFHDQDRLRLDWLSCIRTREQNVSPVEHATKIMVIVDLATRSMWEGGAFEFDPGAMRSRMI